MKLTDKHVSEDRLNWIIASFDIKNKSEMHHEIISALLELKQRRAEDRHKEAMDASET